LVKYAAQVADAVISFSLFKNFCLPMKIGWPPAQNPHQKVLSVSGDKLVYYDLSNSRFRNIIDEHENIGTRQSRL